MRTLWVENVPDELYEALRERARRNRRSISAEVLSVLAESVPTAAGLKPRAELLRLAGRVRARRSAGRAGSAEEMQREDRDR